MTKFKVDLKSGFLEVEGEEAFVREIYSDYKDVLALLIARQSEETNKRELPPSQDTTDSTIEEEKPAPPTLASKKTSRTKAKNMESHKVMGDLNLNPEGKASLRSFVADKNPADAGETNAVVVYYLQKILGTEGITPDHVYTCFKHVEKKVPTALVQSLKDAMRRKGWIDVTDMNKIRITIGGENFVEHDLPRIAAPVASA